MARLINILAASVGGGLVLGATLRVAEAVLARENDSLVSTSEQRRGETEAGASSPDPYISMLEKRMEAQRRDVESLRTQLASATTGIGKLNAQSERLRAEVREWVDASIDGRVAETGARLRITIENSQREAADAIVNRIQDRVILRISKLEEEVTGQSAAMAELRDCSLQTERSMHKLLEGIDRLVGAENPRRASGPATNDAQAPELQKRESRRWGLFS